MVTFGAVLVLTFVLGVVLCCMLAPWVKQPKELQTPESPKEVWLSERKWDL